MKHKKIIITEGTGVTAQALARYFGKENHVVLLSGDSVNARNNNYAKATDGYNVTYWRWDAKHIEKHWAHDIEGAHIVINLAKENRIESTHTLANVIRQTVVPPKVWITASDYPDYEKAIEEERTPFTRKILLQNAGNVEDAARHIEWCIEHTDMEGTYSCAATGTGNGFAIEHLHCKTC